VRLTGLDLTPEMLALAEASAKSIGRAIELKEGDAQDLPFEDESFDTVVCTYGLCGVPDDAGVISKMKRVLKPGGRLILVDHIRSSLSPIFWCQWLYELIWSRARGGYVTRRPVLLVMAAGLPHRRGIDCERESSSASSQ
jgi:ubiquinone/menaquinone biosynthesis C-methylase UbiE